jgi:hypothetical protein
LSQGGQCAGLSPERSELTGFGFYNRAEIMPADRALVGRHGVQSVDKVFR